jgi:ribulose-5-phosphate 4-epimerase/fuculose-1-phosphate aldolase
MVYGSGMGSIGRSLHDAFEMLKLMPRLVELERKVASKSEDKNQEFERIKDKRLNLTRF